VCQLECVGGTTKCGTICTNLQNDPNHCGACNTACTKNANQSAFCLAGVCDAQCDTNFGDCNMQAGDGCETNLTNDASHCGACNFACTAANASTKCTTGQCSLDQCSGTYADCDANYATGCEIDTADDDSHCGACNNACANNETCQAGQCVVNQQPATCQDILTTMNMWGNTAKGVDLRAWTNSTLHYIGCNGDGCTPASFTCSDNSNAETLEFGSSGTVRALVDPGNALGDQMATNYSGCCGSNDKDGLCNAPDSNNNGVNVNSAQALCNALGYVTGQLVASVNSNTCPEVHVLTADGLNWSSDYVSSNGYGRQWKCTGFK
jgi:hypothetical protein